MMTKGEFTARAFAMGVSDVRFADARGELAFGETERFDLASRLPGASCLVVLFTGYLPAEEGAPAGFMPLSAYYVASNTGYHAAKALASLLRAQGAPALPGDGLPARAAALRTGGFIGDNGFFYHERLGSYAAIHLLLTGAFEPDAPVSAENRCTHCGACAAACPSAAAKDLAHCLRRHINREVPEPLRGDVYQILGCERCQTACPLNPPGRSAPHLFALEALLSGGALGAVRALAGSNFVRPGRLASQAALYAAATGERSVLPRLRALAQSAAEPVRTHARWAIEKLSGGQP